MSSTKGNLNSTDIVAIIKACGETKVRRFQMGNLKFSFEDAPTVFHPFTQVVGTENPESTITTNNQEDIGDLVLTDPARWEAIQTGEEKLDETT